MTEATEVTEESLVIAGRTGHADFINGQYNLQDEVR